MPKNVDLNPDALLFKDIVSLSVNEPKFLFVYKEDENDIHTTNLQHAVSACTVYFLPSLRS